MEVSLADIGGAARDLGLAGRPLCVHSSLSSFGHVDRGAETVIAGLLAEECTVLVPTFSYAFAVSPTAGLCPERNGWDYGWDVPMPGGEQIYDPTSNELDREDMGAIPAALLAMPERVRGDHPLNSFAAVGPLAETLISGQRPLDVYAPLQALAEAGGAVVLMGVELDKLTILHLAEQMAGRTLFRRWANGPDGLPSQVEAGSCSYGFPKLEGLLSPLASTATVGSSRWRTYPVTQLLEAASRAIREDPLLTHCGSPLCARCRDAVLGGPIISTPAAER